MNCLAQPARGLWKAGRHSTLFRLYLPSIVSGAAGKFGSFSALIILAWVMPPESFGLLAAATLVSQSLAGLFAASTLPTVARRAANMQQLGLTETLSTSMRLPLIAAVICSAVGMALAVPSISLLAHGDADWRFVIMGALAGAPVLLDGLLSIQAGHGRTSSIMYAEIVRGGTAFGATVAAGVIGGAWAAATAMLAAEALVAMVWAFIMSQIHSRDQETPSSAAPVIDPSELRVAGMAFGGNLAVQIGLWSVQLTLARSYGLIVLAAYSVANRFATAALLLPSFLTRNLLGHMSRAVADADWKRYSRDVSRYFSISALLATTAGIISLLLTQTLFAGLFNRYPLATEMLAILLFASVPAAMSTALGVSLITLESWRAWIVTDLAFAMIVLTWSLLCIVLARGVIELLIGLPVAYVALTAARVRLARVAMRTRTS